MTHFYVDNPVWMSVSQIRIPRRQANNWQIFSACDCSLGCGTWFNQNTHWSEAQDKSLFQDKQWGSHSHSASWCQSPPLGRGHSCRSPVRGQRIVWAWKQSVTCLVGRRGPQRIWMFMSDSEAAVKKSLSSLVKQRTTSREKCGLVWQLDVWTPRDHRLWCSTTATKQPEIHVGMRTARLDPKDCHNVAASVPCPRRSVKKRRSQLSLQADVCFILLVTAETTAARQIWDNWVFVLLIVKYCCSKPRDRWQNRTRSHLSFHPWCFVHISFTPPLFFF